MMLTCAPVGRGHAVRAIRGPVRVPRAMRPPHRDLASWMLAVSCMASSACSGKDARLAWSEIRERYFAGYLERDPVTATYLGGDAYSPELADVNATLPDVTREGRADASVFYHSILAGLEAIDPAALGPDDAIDREVVRAQVRFLLHLLDDLRYYQRSVDTYTVAPFRGVDWQIQQMTELQGGDRGTAQEWDRVVRRVRAIPAYLRAAQANLREGIQAGNVPDHRLVRFDGVDAAASNAAYFAEALPAQAGKYLTDQPYKDEVVKGLREAGPAAAAAFRELGSFLEEAYRPLPGADRYAAGEDEYQWRLRNNLRLGPEETAGSLFEYAQNKVEESQGLLIEVAKEVARRRRLRLDWGSRAAAFRSVRAVMDDLSSDYPQSDDEMFRVYRAKAMELVEYARRHGMFDLPKEYRLEIVETPPMLEGTLEAAYYPAPAFKPSGIGRFYLTASHGDVGVLKENNLHAVADLCAHEGFPGHDWQYQVMRQRVRSIGNVRWLTPGGVEDSSSMWEGSRSAEGWALYAEQLVGEPQPEAPGGFYEPEERLYQLKWQTLPDARVRLDTCHHTGCLMLDESGASYMEYF